MDYVVSASGLMPASGFSTPSMAKKAKIHN